MAQAHKDSNLLGGHAVVLGGSMAGLLAARILANHFTRVTVVEQDVLPDGPEVHKGAPQARHGHSLLGRGAAILERLFPGIGEDLVARGAVEMDPARDFLWYQGGVLKCRFDSDMHALGTSRALLEWRVREHLLRQPHVELRGGLMGRGLVLEEGTDRVSGVTLMPVGGGAPVRLDADLVVDATGRGSRASQWLETLGFAAPEKSVITANVGYATRVYRLKNPQRDWKCLLQISSAPTKRLGVVLPMEGDAWMVTLMGYHGDHPPSDEAGFLAYARGLPYPDLYEALLDAEPLSDISLFRVPSSIRRHFERLKRIPERFVVLGDAACSFNPIFAQGMTAAALGADALQDCLQAAAREGQGLTGFSRRFHKELARVTLLPWQTVASEDFRYVETTGPKAPGASVMHWYMDRIHRLSSVDPKVMRRFLGIMHMQDSPAALFDPRFALKVLLSRSPAVLPQASAPSVPEACVSPAHEAGAL